MSKKYGRSTTVSEKVYHWLDEYRDHKGLRSVAQAIEWLIREAGYDLDRPCYVLTPTEVT